MKDKSWIIILIMGIALTISIGYSIVLNQSKKNAEHTVTTTSIIEMTATTVTIKNILTGSGNVEYKENEQTTDVNLNETENLENENIDNSQIEANKIYQITLSIEDKNFSKVKVGQDVEVTIKNNEQTLNYIGKVIKINKDINNKSTLNVEIINPDINIKEQVVATCKVILEKAENVVGLPVEAIQKDEEGKEYVDVVQQDGTTELTYIKTGLSDDYYVEITSGLEVGDRVQIVKSSTTVVEQNVTSEK